MKLRSHINAAYRHAYQSNDYVFGFTCFLLDVEAKSTDDEFYSRIRHLTEDCDICL